MSDKTAQVTTALTTKNFTTLCANCDNKPANVQYSIELSGSYTYIKFSITCATCGIREDLE